MKINLHPKIEHLRKEISDELKNMRLEDCPPVDVGLDTVITDEMADARDLFIDMFESLVDKEDCQYLTEQRLEDLAVKAHDRLLVSCDIEIGKIDCYGIGRRAAVKNCYLCWFEINGQGCDFHIPHRKIRLGKAKD